MYRQFTKAATMGFPDKPQQDETRLYGKRLILARGVYCCRNTLPGGLRRQYPSEL
jgi:hypothetical protein